ncbi:MAG: hypothetical protein M3N16_02160 [Actinomycetota bacterium]|nr:hypothetical protein [Actinomycetota bacterium]
MTLYDLTFPEFTETPFEATAEASPVAGALAYLHRLGAEGTVERFSPADMAAPRGPRESAEQLAVVPLQVVATPTAPAGMTGGLRGAAYRLATMPLEPLARPTMPLEPLARPMPAAFQGHAAVPAAATLFDVLQRRHRAAVEPTQRESRAYRTFTELADWLGMTQEDAARLLGMGRTTPLAWRRGHEPQPARARRLYQTHALLSTLVRRLGREQTLRWLDIGDPAPLELIRRGDVTAADDLAEQLIFGAAPSRERLGAWVEEPEASSLPDAAPAQAQPRRVRRRAPRRRRR